MVVDEFCMNVGAEGEDGGEERRGTQEMVGEDMENDLLEYFDGNGLEEGIIWGHGTSPGDILF